MAEVNNHLTLAVAGSRKTQSIVDQCDATGGSERTLILTYTTANQRELRNRLNAQVGLHPQFEVNGWFAFLIANFVRPFVPLLFPGQRVRGFDFDSGPQTYKTNRDKNRYFTSDDSVRMVHLAQLVEEIEVASQGAGIQRLEQVYDRIFIDEVQDLCGYDLEILRRLMSAATPLEMVGDIRQATLATNRREKKNRKYMYMKIGDWFDKREEEGILEISDRSETWRCTQEIANFADSIFAPIRDFPPTVSMNSKATAHDGVYLVRENDVGAYVEKYAPFALRQSVSSGKHLNRLTFGNFGAVKGLGYERVLIFPTEPIRRFVRQRIPLDPGQAAPFYVAVTRAQQSVAIILDDAGSSELQFWTP